MSEALPSKEAAEARLAEALLSQEHAQERVEELRKLIVSLGQPPLSDSELEAALCTLPWRKSDFGGFYLPNSVLPESLRLALLGRGRKLALIGQTIYLTEQGNLRRYEKEASR